MQSLSTDICIAQRKCLRTSTGITVTESGVILITGSGDSYDFRLAVSRRKIQSR